MLVTYAYTLSSLLDVHDGLLLALAVRGGKGTLAAAVHSLGPFAAAAAADDAESEPALF